MLVLMVAVVLRQILALGTPDPSFLETVQDDKRMSKGSSSVNRKGT
jgi:hypothetical protein